MENMTLQTVIQQRKDLMSSELDGETVMMSIQQGKYYGIDHIGSRIWALIKEPRSIASICEILLKEYEVSPMQCEQDVLAFAQELAREELIEIQR